MADNPEGPPFYNGVSPEEDFSPFQNQSGPAYQHYSSGYPPQYCDLPQFGHNPANGQQLGMSQPSQQAKARPQPQPNPSVGAGGNHVFRSPTNPMMSYPGAPSPANGGFPMQGGAYPPGQFNGQYPAGGGGGGGGGGGSFPGLSPQQMAMQQQMQQRMMQSQGGALGSPPQRSLLQQQLAAGNDAGMSVGSALQRQLSQPLMVPPPMARTTNGATDHVVVQKSKSTTNLTGNQEQKDQGPGSAAPSSVPAPSTPIGEILSPPNSNLRMQSPHHPQGYNPSMTTPMPHNPFANQQMMTSPLSGRPPSGTPTTPQPGMMIQSPLGYAQQGGMQSPQGTMANAPGPSGQFSPEVQMQMQAEMMRRNQMMSAQQRQMAILEQQRHARALTASMRSASTGAMPLSQLQQNQQLLNPLNRTASMTFNPNQRQPPPPPAHHFTATNGLPIPQNFTQALMTEMAPAFPHLHDPKQPHPYFDLPRRPLVYPYPQGTMEAPADFAEPWTFGFCSESRYYKLQFDRSQFKPFDSDLYNNNGSGPTAAKGKGKGRGGGGGGSAAKKSKKDSAADNFFERGFNAAATVGVDPNSPNRTMGGPMVTSSFSGMGAVLPMTGAPGPSTGMLPPAMTLQRQMSAPAHPNMGQAMTGGMVPSSMGQLTFSMSQQAPPPPYGTRPMPNGQQVYDQMNPSMGMQSNGMMQGNGSMQQQYLQQRFNQQTSQQGPPPGTMGGPMGSAMPPTQSSEGQKSTCTVCHPSDGENTAASAKSAQDKKEEELIKCMAGVNRKCLNFAHMSCVDLEESFVKTFRGVDNHGWACPPCSFLLELLPSSLPRKDPSQTLITVSILHGHDIEGNITIFDRTDILKKLLTNITTTKPEETILHRLLSSSSVKPYSPKTLKVSTDTVATPVPLTAFPTPSSASSDSKSASNSHPPSQPGPNATPEPIVFTPEASPITTTSNACASSSDSQSSSTPSSLAPQSLVPLAPSNPAALPSTSSLPYNPSSVSSTSQPLSAPVDLSACPTTDPQARSSSTNSSVNNADMPLLSSKSQPKAKKIPAILGRLSR